MNKHTDNHSYDKIQSSQSRAIEGMAGRLPPAVHQGAELDRRGGQAAAARRLGLHRTGDIQAIFKGDNAPSGAVPVFFMRTPGGWKMPVHISQRLTGWVSRVLSTNLPRKDIVMALLSLIDRDGPNVAESDDIKRRRHKAAFWRWQLLDACEGKELRSIVASDVLWQVILAAMHFGREVTILELYKDQQLLADLDKAQAFQSGRGPDELARRLEASWLKLRGRGRRFKPREVAEAAGGVWHEIDDCWESDDLDSLPSVPNGALYDRLDKIHRKHS